MRMFIIALVIGFYAAPAMAGGHLESERAGKKDRFAMADSNGDNQISRAEFLALAEKRFAKMDKNGDGVLSKDEMNRKRHSH